MSVLSTLQKLIQIPGVSGYEAKVRETIRSLIKEENVEVDALGNLTVSIGEGDRSILLTAHMDEIGLVVTNIEEDGKIKFRKVGGIDDRVLISQHVTIHSDGGDIPGVIGIAPPHLQLEKEARVIPWNELYIDVGATSADEVRELGVELLNQVTFYKPWRLLNKGRVLVSRAIDDRLGCSLLVELLNEVKRGRVKPKCRIYFSWTSQEEVGCRGAYALAHRLKPDFVVVVDTTSCCNPVITGPLAPGNGPVIRAIDNSSILDPNLAKDIVALAKSNNIPVQIASAGGGTDIVAFQRINVPSIAIGVAVKYTHSVVEYVRLNDVESLMELLRMFLER